MAPDTEDCAKEKRSRASHRGQLTKLFTRFDEVYATGDADEVSIVLELIDNKIKLLETLDKNILTLVEDTLYEATIEEADDYLINVRHQYGRYLRKRNKLTTHDTSTGPTATTSPSKSRSYRLPKLTITKFNGNVLLWQTFEDDFNSAIGTNDTLTPIEKFQFLRAQLEGEAYSTIAGLPLTDANYRHAFQLLKERYGEKQRIISAYMQALWQLPRTSSDVTGLRSFMDKLETYVRGLTALGKAESSYQELLVPMLLDKIHRDIRQQITRSHGIAEFTLQELRETLRKELRAMEAGDSNVTLDCNTFSTSDYAMPFSSETNATAAFHTNAKRNTHHRGRFSTTPVANKPKCAWCKGDHYHTECVVVSDVNKRYDIAKRENICFNCLGAHRVNECRSRKSCKNCHKRHHTALCSGTTGGYNESRKNTSIKPKEKTRSDDISKGKGEEAHQEKVVPTDHHAKLAHAARMSPILLKTAKADVSNQRDQQINATILFDEGATRTFITKHLADRIQLETARHETINLAVFGNESSQSQTFDVVNFAVITPKGQAIELSALIVPQISTPFQNLITRDLSRLPYLRNLTLAHPPSDEASFNISILIGADHYWDLVEDHVVRGSGPTAVSSKLGYLLSGPALPTDYINKVSAFHLFTQPAAPLDVDDLPRLWDLDAIGIEDPGQPPDPDITNLKDFQQYIRKAPNEPGYVAKLPWKLDHQPLPTNYANTCQRTRTMIRKLSDENRAIYHRIITDQDTRRFIERVTEDDPNAGHYLPHRSVKKDSITTPIRIVYDCSAKANKTSPSLNDCLQKGPPLLNDLVGMLIRFRTHETAFVSDIEKAFLNITLDEGDRNFTKFLWLEDPDDPESNFIVYRFSSVLFGSVSSPALLNAVVRTHLDQYQTDVANDLKENIYVDNVASGTLPEQAIAYYEEANDMLDTAGFTLRSWASNNAELRALARRDGLLLKEETVPILGMKWNTTEDSISFKQYQISTKSATKREILKHVSSVYDPLGYLAPVQIRAKILLQELWKCKVDWDEPLPSYLQTTWDDLQRDFDIATRINIPRRYIPNMPTGDCELHCFADASLSRGYGAAVYLKIGNKTSLVMTKSRVAPTRPLTIPRMELMAAVLGTRLTSFIKHQLHFNVTKCVLWSDSQIVLSWLKTTKHLPTFVQNRITEVKAGCFMNFSYCPTHQNPADLLTRGISATALATSYLWWNGPDWLGHGEWPLAALANDTVLLQHEDDDLEDPPASDNDSKDTPNIMRIMDIKRFRSITHLTRVTALVLKFTKLMKGDKDSRAPIKVKDLIQAENIWLQALQSNIYHQEIQAINGVRVRAPLVRQLRLFLDDNGILRVGGRLQNAPLDYVTKFPALLPRVHDFTRLIVQRAHRIVLHSGIQATTTNIRHSYWIPQIRNVVKSVLRNCVICKKLTGKPFRSPISPPLQSFRVQDAPPFEITGIDFTGHLFVITPTQEKKVYVCLFTCAVTRGIHLEIVNDMSTISFLNAFRRFAARRSLPAKIISDNATTFLSAAEEIKRLEQYMQNNHVIWHFIPKRAPWFGGFWERLIGLTKLSLKKVLGRARVDLDELNTITAEIEATLNDRPITYVSDGEPLTPAHLMHGRLLRTLPGHLEDEDATFQIRENTGQRNLEKRAQRLNQVFEHFRQRWRNEYLTAKALAKCQIRSD
ncbi:uncharacterized protein LOC135492635 [Lineus longissimus]|uniref:uncharacterized protein LOC135492635 n=1 Tax=Lineus longissimus TaxID=88925 RepID=UPI00315D34A3